MNEKPFRIFVVEDNDWYNKLIVHNLSLNPDYEVISCFSGKECINRLVETPDVITLDYRLPDMNGFEVLKRIKQENDEIQVILISEQEDIEVVVDLLKSGAYDYIVKSDDIREKLLNTIANIQKGARLKKELATLRKEVQKKYDFQKLIIGESQPVKKVFELIQKALTSNIPVTISGETGTGKELVAKSIHYNSVRKDKAFVPVNVGAMPSELIESELFGHEKGAFTGASFRRIGKFEEADGGTLFLDEIGDMDSSFQVKLLRALQEKEVVRVGSNKAIKVDCRLIVATNKNLQEEVKSGKFRSDLYYRLFGLPIELPPLRERGNDISILASYFLHSFCIENNFDQKSFSADAQKKLYSYDYPGNIRELKSVVELAATLSNDNIINPVDIIFGTNDLLTEAVTDEMTLREYEIKIVRSYLKKYNNDVRLVAQKLDISLSTIYRMLKEIE